MNSKIIKQYTEDFKKELTERIFTDILEMDMSKQEVEAASVKTLKTTIEKSLKDEKQQRKILILIGHLLGKYFYKHDIFLSSVLFDTSVTVISLLNEDPFEEIKDILSVIPYFPVLVTSNDTGAEVFEVLELKQGLLSVAYLIEAAVGSISGTYEWVASDEGIYDTGIDLKKNVVEEPKEQFKILVSRFNTWLDNGINLYFVHDTVSSKAYISVDMIK